MSNEEFSQDIADQLSNAGIDAAVPTDFVKTRSAIAAHFPQDGVITSIEVRFAPPPPPRKFCSVAQLYDLSGFGRTEADGSVGLRIREFLCPGAENFVIQGADEVWVVATPRSSEPVYLTHLVLAPEDPPGPLPPPDPNDIQVRIFAWDSAGQPAPNVSFTWRVLLHGFTPVG
jgi:hypothetical protein